MVRSIGYKGPRSEKDKKLQLAQEWGPKSQAREDPWRGLAAPEWRFFIAGGPGKYLSIEVFEAMDSAKEDRGGIGRFFLERSGRVKSPWLSFFIFSCVFFS